MFCQNRREFGRQGIAKMKKIPGATKPPGIFLPTDTMWNAVEQCGKIGQSAKNCPVFLHILEARAVNAATLRTTDFVDEREFKGTVTVGSCEQARGVDIIAETDVELLVIKAGANDNGIHQLFVRELVGHTRPEAKLEGLVVAAAVAQQELEGVTYVDLPGWALEERNDARAETELLAWHKLTACVEGEFAVKRDIGVLKGLVGTVQVAERTAKVEVGLLAEYAEPQYTCRHVGKEEAFILNDIAGKVLIEPAVAIMLAWPLKVGAVDAAVAQAEVGAEHEVVRFFAVSTHFLGIRARNTGLDGGKFRGARFVAPQGSAQTKVIVAAHR